MSEEVVDEAEITFDEDLPEPESVDVELSDPVVTFSPTSVATVKVPSGATYRFRPGAAIKMYTSDVEFCMEQGVDGEVL